MQRSPGILAAAESGSILPERILPLSLGQIKRAIRKVYRLIKSMMNNQPMPSNQIWKCTRFSGLLSRF